MQRKTKELYGTRLAALDGEIGHVKDFYFDDKNWVVRYMVVDTGTWLTSRLVLLSPHVFGHFDPQANILQINLTRARIESSPPIESHRPVSRQYEIDFYRYYGWPAYWNGGALWGMGGYPTMVEPSKAEMEDRKRIRHRDDKHLQSTNALTGYAIQAIDGPIGVVGGLVVDDRSWQVNEMVVDTGHWYAGKEFLISAAKIQRISYEESKVFVTVTKAEIECTSADEMAGTLSGLPGAKGS